MITFGGKAGGTASSIIKAGGMVVGLLLLGACVPAPAPIATAEIAERDMLAATLMRDIEVLASDDFGGRKPGTPGEQKTLGFMIEEMTKAGFESGTNDPGNPWRAPVPLINTSSISSTIIFAINGEDVEVPTTAGAAYSSRRQARVEGVQLVFVGRESESVSREDIQGQVVVMIGEPGASPARRANLFSKEPAAIITVVDSEDSIAQQKRFRSRERLSLASEEEFTLSAFVTDAAMNEALGADYWAELRGSADGEEFAPLDVTATVTIDARAARREFVSYNVIGRLPGTNPDAGSVLLLGHWDHLGLCGSDDAEDRVCNGAIDNASGIAVMLELARRLAASGPHDRDIYLMGTTAEESGLLGAYAFADEPPVPLDTIVAAFNFDTVAIAPAGSPVGIIGKGRTALDPIIAEVMAAGEREAAPDELAEQFIRRQDGWALLQEDVPTVMITTAFGSEATLSTYLQGRYHRPNDEIDGIELGGAIDDLLLHEELIKRTANSAIYPAPEE